MRKSLILGLSLAALALPVRADTRKIYQAGYWELDAGTADNGSAVCIAETDFGKNRFFGIKYFEHEDSLIVHVMDNGWNMRRGTQIDIELVIDDYGPWRATATGLGKFLQFDVPIKNVTEFADEFARGDTMTLSFPRNRENDWVAHLDGTEKVMPRFVDCVGAINR